MRNLDKAIEDARRAYILGLEQENRQLREALEFFAIEGSRTPKNLSDDFTVEIPISWTRKAWRVWENLTVRPTAS